MSSDTKIEILKNILNFAYASRGEHLFYCPYCNHHNPKMSINIDKNVYKCWICDTKGMDIWRLVRKFGDFHEKRKWKSLSGEIDASNLNIFDLFAEENAEEIHQKILLPEEFVSLANKDLPVSSRPAMKYLASRSVGKAEIINWKIGFCSRGEFKGRIVFPSFDNAGDVNYFVARSYKGDWMKYKNPPVSRDIIFNELFVDWREKVYLVEGIFDAIAVGMNAIPILGSTMNSGSKLFKKIIENDTAVYIALDDDAEKKSMRIVENLNQHGIEVYKVDTSEYDDIAAMPKKVLDKRIESAIMLTNEDVLSRTIRTIGV